MTSIAQNYRSISARVADAAARAGRDPGGIKLLAAAKSQDVERVRAAIAAGVSLIGENYVQEAQAKRARLADHVEWHMIGHLQRNKARTAAALFDVIESLDSVALARELDKEASRSGKKVRGFIEVNLARERSKTGVPPEELPALTAWMGELDGVEITGLMVVPPVTADPEGARPYFRELRRLGEQVNAQGIANVNIRELSMGMSHDFTVAIEEGATIVRIGTALFGPRKR